MEKISRKSTSKLRIASLFAGAGGLDLGFIQAGHDVVWAVDSDTDACETYKKNIGPHIVNADVEAVDLEEIPEVDLVIGGFPCQGFSMANMSRDVSDERNTLYKAFVKAISLKKPKFFLAENVRGILSLGKGKVIEKILSDFESQGYRVEFRVFNAADFMVPQNRVRVFILGIRKDLGIDSFPWPTPKVTEKNGFVSVSAALKSIPEPTDEHSLKNHIGSLYKVTNRNFTGHRKTDPNKPSPTILARGNGKGGVCAIQHPKNHRRMTVREQALIQTFPIDFEFVGSMGSMYRQVGNAVPVKLAFEIAKSFNEVTS